MLRLCLVARIEYNEIKLSISARSSPPCRQRPPAGGGRGERGCWREEGPEVEDQGGECCEGERESAGGEVAGVREAGKTGEEKRPGRREAGGRACRSAGGVRKLGREERGCRRVKVPGAGEG